MEKKVSIVVPAHNEAGRIGSTLEGLLRGFPEGEIIVVADGCTDSTAEIVRGYPRIRLIESGSQQGKGGAIVLGLRSAGGDFVGFLDADGSFSPGDVEDMLSYLGGGVDCVIASKWVGRRFSEVGESFTRKVAGRFWNLFVRLFLGLDLADTQAGAKFMTREAFVSLGDSFVSRGFEFDVELLYRLKRGGKTIKEVYTPFSVVENSTFKYSKAPSMFLNLLRIWLS